MGAGFIPRGKVPTWGRGSYLEGSLTWGLCSYLRAELLPVRVSFLPKDPVSAFSLGSYLGSGFLFRGEAPVWDTGFYPRVGIHLGMEFQFGPEVLPHMAWAPLLTR